MNAKDYLSGVYLDTKKFSKKETIELMEDYFKYKTEYNEQQVKNLTIHVVSKPFYCWTDDCKNERCKEQCNDCKNDPLNVC